MPKTKKAVKETKQKLTPDQRSQIAKDRWAKRRGEVTDKNAENATNITVTWPESGVVTMTTNGTVTDRTGVVMVTNLSEPAVIVQDYPVVAIKQEMTIEEAKARFTPPVETHAPQLAPVAPKKQKRYTGPKEFSVALKVAEGRLAKAINERAESLGKLAGLNAEIPSLMGIIQALRGSQAPPVMYDVSVPYDLSLGMPQQFQSPIPQYQDSNPMQAFQAAQVAPPISRAQGGAVQFGPEVVGELEGPEDDNPDRFITGPNAGGGWIGA